MSRFGPHTPFARSQATPFGLHPSWLQHPLAEEWYPDLQRLESISEDNPPLCGTPRPVAAHQCMHWLTWSATPVQPERKQDGELDRTAEDKGEESSLVGLGGDIINLIRRRSHVLFFS